MKGIHKHLKIEFLTAPWLCGHSDTGILPTTQLFMGWTKQPCSYDHVVPQSYQSYQQSSNKNLHKQQPTTIFRRRTNLHLKRTSSTAKRSTSFWARHFGRYSQGPLWRAVLWCHSLVKRTANPDPRPKGLPFNLMWQL